MNPEHYSTPKIEYKDKKLYPTGKMLTVASFSMVVDGSYGQAEEFNIRMSQIMQMPDIRWVIGESYGGLYYVSRKFHRPDGFDTVLENVLFVHVPDTIFTFCQLKFGDNLTTLKI